MSPEPTVVDIRLVLLEKLADLLPRFDRLIDWESFRPGPENHARRERRDQGWGDTRRV